MRNVSWIVMILALTVSLSAGCAHQVKTVHTEQTVQYPAQAAERPPEKTLIVEKETTTTETRHESQGVLSTTVHIIGEVLALPFRLIGGLLRLIF